MKKFVFVLTAMAMSIASFAQTWENIGAPFTATDINGNTVSLADTLAAGKYVMIDYSCTWCGPCWSLHQTGILEYVQSNMPNVSVIWVEAEESNTIAQIYGPAGGSTYADATQGNWTVDAQGNPVNYPIIDDDSNRTCLRTCLPLYEGSVPSVYFITPHGHFCSLYGESYGIGNTGAATVANLNALMANAPQAGTLPAADIRGNNSIVKNHALPLYAHVISVDSVTSITWTATGDATFDTTEGQYVEVSWVTPGNYTVTVTVTNTSGSSTATLSVEVLNYIYFCGFEEEDNVEDTWNFVDADGDGYNWMPTSQFIGASAAPSYSHSGQDSYLSFSYINNVGPFNPDNWLISPAITLPNSSTLKVEWYDRTLTSSYPDRYAVYVSTSGNTPADFTSSALITRNVSNTSWGKRTKTLSAYAGQTIYLGFRHYNSQDQYMFLIDDLRIYDTNPAAGIDDVDNISFELYPNPVTDKVRVDVEGLREISVMDVSGRVLMTQGNNPTVDMSALSNGIYFVRVITDNGSATQKVVKK